MDHSFEETADRVYNIATELMARIIALSAELRVTSSITLSTFRQILTADNYSRVHTSYVQGLEQSFEEAFSHPSIKEALPPHNSAYLDAKSQLYEHIARLKSDEAYRPAN
jgi:hypothetical protein